MQEEHARTITTTGAVLGEILVLLRKQKGVTQKELADHVGISASTWSRIEKGDVGISIDQLRAAAACLGMRAAEILDHVERVEEHLKSMHIHVDGKASKKSLLASLKNAWSATGVMSAVGSVVGAASGVGLASRAVLPLFGAALAAVVAGVVLSQIQKDK